MDPSRQKVTLRNRGLWKFPYTPPDNLWKLKGYATESSSKIISRPCFSHLFFAYSLGCYLDVSVHLLLYLCTQEEPLTKQNDRQVWLRSPNGTVYQKLDCDKQALKPVTHLSKNHGQFTSLYCAYASFKKKKKNLNSIYTSRKNVRRW